jgi:hypothetical protein
VDEAAPPNGLDVGLIGGLPSRQVLLESNEGVSDGPDTPVFGPSLLGRASGTSAHRSYRLGTSSRECTWRI